MCIVHIHIQSYTPLTVKFFTDCLISYILGNGEVIKYHIFISVVVIELSVRYLIQLDIQGLKTG